MKYIFHLHPSRGIQFKFTQQLVNVIDVVVILIQSSPRRLTFIHRAEFTTRSYEKLLNQRGRYTPTVVLERFSASIGDKEERLKSQKEGEGQKTKRSRRKAAINLVSR